MCSIMGVAPSLFFFVLLIEIMLRYKDPLKVGCEVYADIARLELKHKNPHARFDKSNYKSEELYAKLLNNYVANYLAPSEIESTQVFSRSNGTSYSRRVNNNYRKNRNTTDPDQEIDEFLSGKRSISDMSAEAQDTFFEDYDGD